MSSLKEFASARKLEPCPSTTSPNSLSQVNKSTVETPANEMSFHNDTKPSVEHTPQLVKPTCGFTPGQSVHTNELSRSTVETPAKKQSVHTDAKPSVEHTPLGKAQLNQNGGFTPGQSVHTNELGRSTVETPAKEQRVHTDAKPSVEHTPLGKAQLNQNGGFTPGQSVYTNEQNRSTVETPAKEQRVHTHLKPSVEHTPLAKTQMLPNGSFALAQNVKPSLAYTPRGNTQVNPNGTFTPGQKADTIAKLSSFVYTPKANSHVNPNGAFTPGQSGHTSMQPSLARTPLANAQGKPSLVVAHGTSGVTLKSLFFKAGKNSDVEAITVGSVEQGKERKVFNGMTLVLDYNPKNGFVLAPVKCSEPKTEDKVKKQAPDSALKKNPESETLSDEQLSSSPVLFATPNTTPSPSPVKQEPDSFNFPQGEDRTGLNSSNLNLVVHEPSLGNQESDVGKDSTDALKKGDSVIGRSLAKVNTITETPLAKVDDSVIEPSLAAEAGNHNCITTRNISGFEVKEEKKARDILDAVKENSACKKDTERENCLQSAGKNGERDIDSKESVQKGLTFSKGGVSSKSVCEVPSNVRRQSTRRSTRLRRSSNSAGNTRKKQQETNEVRTLQNCAPNFISPYLLHT